MKNKSLLEQLKAKRDALNSAIEVIESIEAVNIQPSIKKWTVKKAKKEKKARKKHNMPGWTPEHRANFMATMKRKLNAAKAEPEEQKLSDFIHNQNELIPEHPEDSNG